MTAIGSVYVFNVCSETLNLSTNGMTVGAGEIPGWFTNAAPKYRPNGVARGLKLLESFQRADFLARPVVTQFVTNFDLLAQYRIPNIPKSLRDVR